MSNSRRFRRLAATNAHSHQRPVWPDWKVNIVVDDEHCHDPGCSHRHAQAGGPPDVRFAYTVGLHQAHGIPEIHLPAVSAEATEIGALPEFIIGQLMNAVAERCIFGHAAPGSVLEFPGTLAGERIAYALTLGEPGPREAVSAFAAHHKATVIPVTWTVHAEAAA